MGTKKERLDFDDIKPYINLMLATFAKMQLQNKVLNFEEVKLRTN